MCDKVEKLKETVSKVLEYKDIVQGETSTRRVLIDPLLTSLGYDIANPYEVINEYTCDFGVKKGEKVDYALMKNADITIIVEAKSIEVELGLEHISQLFRYYSVTDSQIGVLTNGLEYWFFMDTKDKNKMDDKPFLRINIEELDDNVVDLFLLFHKEQYDIHKIKSVFENLSVRNRIRGFITGQTGELDNEFKELVATKTGVEVATDEFSKILQDELKSLLSKQRNISTLKNDISINDISEEIGISKPILLKDMTSQICTGSKITKIVIEDVCYDIKSWSDAIQTLVNHLALKNSDTSWLISLDGTPSENKGFIRRNNERFLKCSQIGDTGLYVDTHGSSYMHIQRMKVVCRNARLNLDDVVMYIY